MILIYLTLSKAQNEGADIGGGGVGGGEDCDGDSDDDTNGNSDIAGQALRTPW